MYACGGGTLSSVCLRVFDKMSNTRRVKDPRLPVDLNQRAQQAFWAEIGSVPKVLNPHWLPDSDSRCQSGK